jgi:hypothetical protein
MTLWAWVVYIVGFFGISRWAFVDLLDGQPRHKRDGITWTSAYKHAVWLGLLYGALWPVTLPGSAVFRLMQFLIFRPTKQEKLAAKQEEMRRLEKEVERLEEEIKEVPDL